MSGSVYQAFCETAQKYPANICLSAGAIRLTYREVQRRVHALAAFLQNTLAVKRGEAVAVYADQSPSWLIISLAIQSVGALEFPRHTDATEVDLETLLQSTACRVFFFSEEKVWQSAAAKLKKRKADAILIDTSTPAEKFTAGVWSYAAILAGGYTFAAEFTAQSFPYSAVISTSGTTGDPKWVPVLQRSFLHAMRVIPRVLNLNARDAILSCLPSWHLYARLVEYVALGAGARIVYSSIPDLPHTLRSSGATLFPSFPVIWEQIYHRILYELAASPVRGLVQWGIATVVRCDRIFAQWFSRTRYETKAARLREIAKLGYLLPLRWLLQNTVFRAIRNRVSPSLRYTIMGDAPLPLVVDEALRALGFEVLEGYGSTEQCVTALRRPQRNFPGAVGRVLPGVHVSIQHAAGEIWHGIKVGEIVVSGDNVFAGYFTSLRALPLYTGGNSSYLTGDLGTLDQQGNLLVLGRKAHAFRLMSGELIIPELVENVLRGSRYVGRVLVFGEGSESPVAIVVPDFHELLLWAGKRDGKIYHENYAASPEKHSAFWTKLVSTKAKDLFMHEFRHLLTESGLPDYAHPKQLHVLPRPFHRGAELTLTLKPRRAMIAKKYLRDA